MRLLQNIPHEHCHIAVYDYNEKYIVHIAYAQFSLEYKFEQEKYPVLSELIARIDDHFIDQCLPIFKLMHQQIKNL